MSREEFFQGTTSNSDPDVYEIEIWRCNWRTVEVYRSCQLTHVGMSGACIGLSAVEIRTALLLHRIPRSRWRDMALDLELMGNAAAQYYAEQAAKKQG